MVLKKQTVWLLTMLSLIIVLSVYYIFSPGGSPTDMAYVDDDENSAEKEQSASSEEQESDQITDQEAAEGEAEVSNIASDETFAALRIDIAEARDQQLEDYQEIVASTDVSAEMKSEAFSKMEALNEQSKQIQILETLLMNQFGYEDVIVNPVQEHNYNVIVKADSLSTQEANEIMRATTDKLGGKSVTVEYAKK